MFENFQLRKDDVTVAGYDFYCENPKAVMFLIHGIGEYAGRYERMANYLAERNIKVISMDHRGHGISSGVRGDAAPRESVLSDINLLIDYGMRTYPGLKYILYGHSMGGNIVLDYKGRGMRNGLMDGFIVSAPWVKLVRPVPKPLYMAVKTGAKVFPTKQIKSECEEVDLGNPLYVKPYKSNKLVHPYITLRCLLQGYDIGEAIGNGTHEDNGITEGKPFLLMHGTEDPICDFKGSEAVAKQYEGKDNFTFIPWEGYLHEIHNGKGEFTGQEVIEAIADFIEGLI